MSLLVLGSTHYAESPQDEGDVRSTVNVVNNDKQPAVAESTPDFNATERDPDTEGGLTTRAVADHVTPSTQYQRPNSNANTDFAAPIDSQISTSGSAAAREDAGQWGHGTLHYQNATEPTIREGAAFEDVYFAAVKPPIQDGTLDYMIPSRTPDDGTSQTVQQASKAAARRAVERNAYQRFLEDRTS